MSKKDLRRQKIKYRIRKVVTGTAESPRLTVYRSNKEIYAQLIDDLKGVTLASASSTEKELKDVKGIEQARQVGLKIAEKAKSARNLAGEGEGIDADPRHIIAATKH